jgi:hypothetical protein
VFLLRNRTLSKLVSPSLICLKTWSGVLVHVNEEECVLGLPPVDQPDEQIRQPIGRDDIGEARFGDI